MKKCICCNIPKELTDFYTHKQMTDGTLNCRTMKSLWRQCDLEEQIAEEHNFLNEKNTKNMAKVVKLSEVIKLLKQGFPRWTKEEKVEGESVQSKLELKFSECKKLYAHEKLKNIRSARVATVEIEDDLPIKMEVKPSAKVPTIVVAEEPKKQEIFG